MPAALLTPAIVRGTLYGVAVFVAIAGLTRLLARRPPFGRLAYPLYLLALTGGVAAFLRNNPALMRPGLVPYYRSLVLFSAIYLAIKLGDVLLVDFVIARRRKFLPPAILRELVCIGLYAVALLTIIATVLHIDLMPLLATSAVLSLVAGLALQETLSNFFAGVTLATERPFKPGEWVQIGQHVGQVMEMGWRAVKIEIFEEDDYLIVPNSVVAKEQIVNFSQPDPINGLKLRVGVHYRHPPSRVIAALLEAVRGVRGVLEVPAPTARVVRYGDSSIEYQLRYWINDFEQSTRVEGDILAGIWYAFKRHGIEIPFPIRTVHLHAVTEETERAAHERGLAERLALVREVDFLSPLSSDEQLQVARSLQPLLYETGRTVVRQGDEGDSLYLVSNGRVGVWVSEGQREGQLVATLGRGQCFGEMSLLTGAPRSATVRTLEDCELFMLGKAQFREVLLANPQVAEALSQILARRQQEHDAALTRDRGAAAQARRADRERQLVSRIRAFFGL
jgi:small-conductance mechanosensitive channel/CRP-like cAMP-binding protein